MTKRRIRNAGACLLAVALLTLAATTRAETTSIVVDVQTGRVLHAKKPNARHYPASVTKLMTAYLAFEAVKAKKLKLSEWAKASKRAAQERGSSLNLKPNQNITVREALMAMIVRSANDAAVVLAEKIAGDVPAFARRMTAKAKALGMTRTVFRNPNGMPDQGHWSTARDLAILARALIRDFPNESKYFATASIMHGGRRLKSTNALLGSYRGADGMKTGFICASGFNLVASARRPGRRLIAVTLGSTTSGARFASGKKLLDRGFAKKITAASNLPTIEKLVPKDGGNGAAPPWVMGSKCALTIARNRKPAIRYEPGWALEIGVHRDPEAARLAAIKVSKELKKQVEGGAPYGFEKAVGGMVRHFAALTGLKERDAIGTCMRFKKASRYCLVLPPANAAARIEDADRLARITDRRNSGSR